MDPHLWLDPLAAVEMVARIRDALGAARPEHAETFSARAAHYTAKLHALHREFQDALTPLRQRTFIAFHAGYGHLAARYGLEEVSILKGLGESEPSPARIAQVIRTARRIQARAIFTEPQFNQRAARLIAEEAGTGLAVLDALGQRGGMTYLELMRENLKQLTAALR
jgi:zinc transport system substrate-binding protein